MTRILETVKNAHSFCACFFGEARLVGRPVRMKRPARKQAGQTGPKPGRSRAEAGAGPGRNGLSVAQVPEKVGRRFSRKARMPSCPSALAPARAMKRVSRSIWLSRLSVAAVWSSFLTPP